jgi:hypothetical protein
MNPVGLSVRVLVALPAGGAATVCEVARRAQISVPIAEAALRVLALERRAEVTPGADGIRRWRALSASSEQTG